MNPAIVIPSYWAETNRFGEFGERGAYDYATPLTKPLPELETCLASLEHVRGVLRVVVLVVSPPECQDAARARVTNICRSHPHLNPLVVGEKEASCVSQTIARMIPNAGEVVSLRGYGAIKNMGIAIAAILGHDSVLFLDDDEVALGPDLLIDAAWGLGTLTKQDLPILAKSGFYIDADGSAFARETKRAWSEKYWAKRKEFNRLMEHYLSSENRLLRSTQLCGGCFSVHAEAFCKVPFDPFITRGEDLDYLLNLRARGIDVWFDNQMMVRWQPPKGAMEDNVASHFLQDAYRWLYENEKLRASNARRDLHTVTPGSLKPYPAPWLSDDIPNRIAKTCVRRIIAGPERKEHMDIYLHGRHEAARWARENASRYISFAQSWPQVMGALWAEDYLASMILRTGSVSKSVRSIHTPAIATRSRA